jgi:DNA-binding NtrC family response regulator
MTAVSPRAELVAAGRLEGPLAARFEGAVAAELPRLRDRPEDLRAIVSDRLAREGLRVRGVPVGIDDAAFARLLDHPFDAEEAELAALAVQLVAACEGDVVRARHVDAVRGGGGSGAGSGVRTGT